MNNQLLDQYIKELKAPNGELSLNFEGAEVLDPGFVGVLTETTVKDQKIVLEKRPNFLILDYIKKDGSFRRATFNPNVLGAAKQLKFTITWNPEDIDLIVFPQ